MIKFEVAKFVYLYGNGKQPHTFDDYFHYVKNISSYHSRMAERNDFYLPLYKSKQTQQSIIFLGVKFGTKYWIACVDWRSKTLNKDTNVTFYYQNKAKLQTPIQNTDCLKCLQCCKMLIKQLKFSKKKTSNS